MAEVDAGRFEEMAAAALDGLTGGLRRRMGNVAVTAEHRPGPPGLPGLCEGVPLTSRTTRYAGVLPDRSTIYLWVPKTCATWADNLQTAVGSVPRSGAGRAGLGSFGDGMIFGLWA